MSGFRVSMANRIEPFLAINIEPLYGIRTENLDYRPQPQKASAYRFQQIFEQIMSLPFFYDVTDKEIDKAKELALLLYRRYFDARTLAAYEGEMTRILAYASPLSSNSCLRTL